MINLPEPLNKSTINNSKKGLNHNITNAVDITSEFVNNILNNDSNEDIIIKNAILNNSQELELFIVNYITTHQALTGGQEGEIHKIEIGDKNYIVAKKRYDNNSKHEYDLQKEAYQISINSYSSIKVPQPIYEFHQGNDGYVLMEYINGKTLYTLSWESIVNQHLIPYLEKYILHEKNNYEVVENDLNELLSRFKVESNHENIQFINDTHAEEGVIEFMNILYKLGVINHNPNTTIKDIDKPHVRKNLALEEYYKKHIGKTIVFDTKKGDHIVSHLDQFIKDMHKNGLYHRDLGGNPRNIMFTEKDTYIIDFGKSETGITKGGYSNIDQMSGGIYDDDEGIIYRIKGLTGEITNNNNDNNIVNYENIIHKGEKKGLTISQNNIKLYNSQLNSINIDKYIDDLIDNNDSSYNWFIYLTEKGVDKDWKIKSNKIGKPKLFILLQLIPKEKLLIIKNKLEQNISTKSKASRSYKYSKLILEYI